MTNDFEKNEDDSKRYRHLMKCFYNHISPGNEPMYLDGRRGFDLTAQTELHIDALLMGKNGNRYSLEEKLADWPTDKNEPHTALYAETESCSKPGCVTNGYMQESIADFLVYSFEISDVGLDIYHIEFVQRLKPWFWHELKQNPHAFKPHRNPDKNQSQGVLIPLGLIARQFPNTKRYLVTFDGQCYELDLRINIFDAYRQFHLPKAG